MINHAFTTRPPLRCIYYGCFTKSSRGFIKIIPLKNNNCTLTMRRQLFCGAKSTLLQCKTIGFTIH
ncbi:MAG: hypothetical protein D8B57_01315 [Prevotella sp.]|nr:MAG: hypothetical protein D8B57_01315 [Prevotella sp.]